MNEQLRIVSRWDGDVIYLNGTIQFYTSPSSYLTNCLRKFIFKGKTRAKITKREATLIRDLRKSFWVFRGKYGFWRKLLKVSNPKKALDMMEEELALFLIIKRLTPRKKGSRYGK